MQQLDHLKNSLNINDLKNSRALKKKSVNDIDKKDT